MFRNYRIGRIGMGKLGRKFPPEGGGDAVEVWECIVGKFGREKLLAGKF